MERINVDLLSKIRIDQISELYLSIFERILEDIRSRKAEMLELLGLTDSPDQSRKLKRKITIGNVLKFCGKILLNVFLVRDADIDPAFLDNELPSDHQSRLNYYAKCKTETLARMCYDDLEKGVTKMTELLSSSEPEERKAAIDMADHMYVGLINFNFTLPKYDLLLLAVLSANDNRINILEGECNEKCQILHNYHNANLGLEYDFREDMKTVREKMESGMSCS